MSSKPSKPQRILLLGGTSEALEIAASLNKLPHLDVISSLAGRVKQPHLPEGLVRVGGFGGVPGLTAYLLADKITAVIDATHPFASRISHNAEQACRTLNLPLLAYARPPWVKVEGDLWHKVPDMNHAASFIAARGGRIFLTIGRQELSHFSALDNAWFLIRTIDPPEAECPSNSVLLQERGPFDLAHERSLMQHHAINFLVSKNSGGPATYAKIQAARELHIPVLMITPPPQPAIQTLHQIVDVLAWPELQKGTLAP